jgi:hypothetical protein
LECPNQDPEVAWNFEDIFKAAKSMFNPNVFDPETAFGVLEAEPEIVKPENVSEPEPIHAEYSSKSSETDFALLDSIITLLYAYPLSSQEYAILYAEFFDYFPTVARDFELLEPTYDPFLDLDMSLTDNYDIVSKSRPTYYDHPDRAMPKSRQVYFSTVIPVHDRFCYFCDQPYPECKGIRKCNEVETYIAAGKVIRVNGKLKFSDGGVLPRREGGMKSFVDAWYSGQEKAKSVQISDEIDSALPFPEPEDLEDFKPV